MYKINSLTQEQIDSFPNYIKKWTDIGLCTDPADRKRAEAAILKMYSFGGLKPPKKIVWCGSPISQGITRAIILDKFKLTSVVDSVRNSVWNSARNSVRDSVADSVKDSVWNSVADSVGNSVRDSVADSVRSSVWNSVKDSVKDSVYGSHEAYWLSFYDFFKDLGLIKETKKLNGLFELSKSAGWVLPHKNICYVSERHNVLNRDDSGRLHNLFGPAIMYPDGWKIYAVHGVRVPEWIVEDPQKITPKKIEEESNLEIKRIMISKYGEGKYLIDSGAKEISKDSYGTLYRKEITNDEPLVVVKVINSTREKDGSLKPYFLRVPPDIKTAKEGVAWTFGVEEKEYAPSIEA